MYEKVSHSPEYCDLRMSRAFLFPNLVDACFGRGESRSRTNWYKFGVEMDVF